MVIIMMITNSYLKTYPASMFRVVIMMAMIMFFLHDNNAGSNVVITMVIRHRDPDTR